MPLHLARWETKQSNAYGLEILKDLGNPEEWKVPNEMQFTQSAFGFKLSSVRTVL